MPELKGKTIVITGGSRGIGEAIGLRCLHEGANVVSLSKDNPTEKSNIINFDVDVRNEQEVEAAIKKIVAQFGGIDILINNVSAFCFTNTVETPPEKFDLMFSVNVRATFMLSKICYPYLQKAANPHILNISPPLDMNSRWFKNHLAFTMSKIGMSMCTLGMANEFKKAGIAVNSLWPQTTIATSTIKEYFKPDVYAGSRWPTIMADAAYEILKRDSRQCTANFFIDEIILRENGMTDFSKYAVDSNATLIQDLFVADSMPEKSIPLRQDLFS